MVYVTAGTGKGNGGRTRTSAVKTLKRNAKVRRTQVARSRRNPIPKRKPEKIEYPRLAIDYKESWD